MKFGDGKTRKVDIKTYDDAYDPQKSLANFQQMPDSVFAKPPGWARRPTAPSARRPSARRSRRSWS